jgi:hypothetical protein
LLRISIWELTQSPNQLLTNLHITYNNNLDCKLQVE